MLAWRNRWRGWRVDRGCEQIAASGVDALLGRRRRRCARRCCCCRRRGGRRRRRRRLITTGTAGGSHPAQGDQSSATSDGQTDPLRTHNQSPVLLVVSLVLAVDPRRFGWGRRCDHLGCEQVASGGVDALLRRRRGRRRCARRRRCRGGGRRRRRCLIAGAFTSGDDRAHCDDSRSTRDGHDATHDAVRI